MAWSRSVDHDGYLCRCRGGGAQGLDNKLTVYMAFSEEAAHSHSSSHLGNVFYVLCFRAFPQRPKNFIKIHLLYCSALVRKNFSVWRRMAK